MYKLKMSHQFNYLLRCEVGRKISKTRQSRNSAAADFFVRLMCNSLRGGDDGVSVVMMMDDGLLCLSQPILRKAIQITEKVIKIILKKQNKKTKQMQSLIAKFSHSKSIKSRPVKGEFPYAI